jgi:thiamine-monophosphate kinase
LTEKQLLYNPRMPSEFELIARYFTRAPRAGGSVLLGVGDDCALLTPQAGEVIAVSTDMLVEGRHFFASTDPEALGHKALAVNLSDLAAMGARPLGFTLALALPAADERWIAPFARGLLALADAHAIPLVGGDTTRGPLNLCITVLGSVAPELALRRDGARPGDEIWVSGELGDARLAVETLMGNAGMGELPDGAAARLHRPQPRVALGLALRGIASAAIDVSDGLLGDLSHILERSGVGAMVEAEAVPVGAALARHPLARQWEFALNGGDDYELCFTAPADQHARVITAATDAGVPVTRIGRILQGSGLQVVDGSGQTLTIASRSFDHFADE